MDQVQIREMSNGKNKIQIIADPKMRNYKDLLVKGGAFYAVYDKDTSLWSQDLQRLGELIDNDILEYKEEHSAALEREGIAVSCQLMQNMSNGAWNRYMASFKNLTDSKETLNQKIIFRNDQPQREDYATQQLDYEIKPGDISYYDLLMSTLYAPEQREKLEWGIGAIIDGKDIEKIQKMFVIYGDPGTGKSTVLKVMEQMFPGYIAYFSADDLGKGYQFATAAFKSSPLIGIQHDGDLSKLWDNTILNEIAAHETIMVNEKGVKQYSIRPRTMLFMATNKPVRITDSKAGLLRRLIDIEPTGNKLPSETYFNALNQIKFELGAIAYHCREVYRKLGYSRYEGYVPNGMLSRTNDLYNFIQDYIYLFNSGEPVKLNQIWSKYKAWCEETNTPSTMKRVEFMYELASYFKSMKRTQQAETPNSTSGVIFEGFDESRFESKVSDEPPVENKIELNGTDSAFDKMAADWPAQYARNDETGAPRQKWQDVTTSLKDLDTSKLHWVKVPENHVVLDFDLRGPDGEKSLEANLKAAAEFPPTYAEVSKSGNGVHLHYIYDGDPSKLKNLYSTHIEIKTYRGNASLRRKLVKCNDLPVNHISSGLPLKGEKSVINQKELKDEKHLRNIIAHALRKEYCPGTKPSIDFICTLLDEAYESEMPYDVRDLRNKILQFAMGSTHHRNYCIGVVGNMKFKSEMDPEGVKPKNGDDLIFFDTEVFPNLFMISFMHDHDENPVTWINPPRKSVSALMETNLVGFNNRKYDNHILYAWADLGYDNEQLYELSKKIVSGDRDALFSQAYNIGYTDIFDFAATKQGLKKWEIALGIDHHELGMDWNKPVPEDKWPLVQSYCEDDVRATKAVFHHLKPDFEAREMLAKMSGLSVNNTTNQHTTKIIFGDVKNPQPEFNWPDLSETFPGYTFDDYAPKDKKSKYMGEYPGEGGYVWVAGMANGDEDQDYQNITPAWERPDFPKEYVPMDNPEF